MMCLKCLKCCSVCITMRVWEWQTKYFSSQRTDLILIIFMLISLSLSLCFYSHLYDQIMQQYVTYNYKISSNNSNKSSKVVLSLRELKSQQIFMVPNQVLVLPLLLQQQWWHSLLLLLYYNNNDPLLLCIIIFFDSYYGLKKDTTTQKEAAYNPHTNGITNFVFHSTSPFFFLSSQ
jgi:hypothetical protein